MGIVTDSGGDLLFIENVPKPEILFDLIRRDALYEERLRKYQDLLKAFQTLQDEEITLTTKLED